MVIQLALAILVLLAGTYLLKVSFKLNWLVALPTCFLALGLLIYFLSLFLGLYGFFVYLIVFLIIEIILLTRVEIPFRTVKSLSKKLSVSNSLITIGFFLPFWLMIKAVDQNWKIVNWDELSGWGPAIWTIFHNDRLWNIGDFYLSNKTYPPLQQLFQFSFLKIAGWNEPLILISNNVAILVFLLGFAGCVYAAKRKAALIAYYLGIVLFYWFGFNFRSVLADGFLAVLFAVSLTLALSLEINKGFIPVIAIYSASLSLVKPTGIFFGCLIAVLASIRLYSLRKEAVLLSNSSGKSKRKAHNMKLKAAYLQDAPTKLSSRFNINALILIAAPFFTWLTWQTYMIASDIPRLLIGHPNYLSIFTTAGQVRLEKTVSAFHHALISPIPELSLIQFGWISSPYFLVLFLVLNNSIFSSKRYSLGKIRIPEAFVILFGWFLYQALMLFSYLFYFTEYEGTRVASFSRYQIGYFFAWLVFLIFRLIQKWEISQILVPLTIVTIFLGFNSNGLTSDLNGITPDSKLVSVRNMMEAQVKQIRPLIKQTDKLYIITQNSTGYEKNLFYYLTLPNFSNYWCWSVGNPYYVEDVWTCPQEIDVLISNYDFLYLNRPDEQVFRLLSSRVTIPKDFEKFYFFRITHNENRLTLIPLL